MYIFNKVFFHQYSISICWKIIYATWFYVQREILKYIHDSNKSSAYFFFIMCILYLPMRFSLPALQNPQFLFSWKVCFENSRARKIKNTFSRVLCKREMLFDINGKHKKRDIGKCMGIKQYNICWLIKFSCLIYITTFEVVNVTMVLFNIK